MGTYLDLLASVPPVVVYVVVAVLIFGESAALLGVFLPGEIVLLAGGTLASLGHASLPTLIVVATIGAVSGDGVGYVIGRKFGPAMRTGRIGRWIGRARWTRAEQSIDRHGAAVVLAGRWIGVLRSLVPAAAGMAGMPVRRYMVLNAVGGIVWVAGVCGVGYLSGGALGSSTLDVATCLVLTVSAIAGCVHLAGQRRRRRQRAPVAERPLNSGMPTP